MTAPFFSVLVPAYNHCDYLPMALESLLAQTDGDFEAVVVDDGSTDQTPEVVARFARLDPRVRSLRRENGGCAQALNTGIENARGQWIGWLSSDDLLEPDALATHRESIGSRPDIRCFHSHFYYLQEETGERSEPGPWTPIPERPYRVSRFFRANYVHGNSIMIHREAFARAGRFDPQLRQGQDFDMWLRLAYLYPWAYTPKRTCVTRWHAGQTTSAFPTAGFYDSAWACLKFANEHPFANFFPDFDLDTPEHARLAAGEAVSIALWEGSFMHQAGYDTSILDRLREWLCAAPGVPAREAAREAAVRAMDCEEMAKAPALVAGALNGLATAREPFAYRQRSIVDVVRRQLRDQTTKPHKRANLLRYLDRLGQRLEEDGE